MTRRRPSVSRRFSGNRRPVVLLVLVLVMLLAAHWFSPLAERPEPERLEPGVYRVQRVVDGDTLVLAGDVRVRLIGANTPETIKPHHPVEPWGLEATQFTRRFVADGEVRLQFDGPWQDKYGRILAHVWVGNRMLGEELIRAGLATAETGYRYSPAIKTRLREAEADARAAGRGIWSR